MSTSKKHGFNRKYLFQIRSSGGRDISGISQFADEGEVLFPSGAKFDIRKVKEDKGQTEIFMEQIADGEGAASIKDLKEAKLPSDETELEQFMREAEEQSRLEREAEPNPVFETENWLGKGKGISNSHFDVLA